MPASQRAKSNKIMKVVCAMSQLSACFTACMLVMAFQTESVSGQMIRVGTPFRTTRDNFYQRHGVRFGMNFAGNNRIRGLNPAGQLLPNVQLTQGSAGATIPSLGGYNPNASLRTGFATVGGDVNVAFGLEMGKGSRRSLSSSSPSVTMMNGGFASIFSGANRPFVTRIDPVVGLGGGHRSSLLRGLSKDSYNEPKRSESIESAPRTYSDSQSTAIRGDLSIAEIKKRRRLNEMVQDKEMLKELEELIERATTMASQGEYGSARAKYSRALRRVSDRTDLQEVREYLQEKLKELRGKR